MNLKSRLKNTVFLKKVIHFDRLLDDVRKKLITSGLIFIAVIVVSLNFFESFITLSNKI